MLVAVKRKRNEAVVKLRKSYQVCLGIFLNITVNQKLVFNLIGKAGWSKARFFFSSKA